METETCECPYAHCRLLCVTPCDHDDPCPHHYRKPASIRVRVAKALRAIAKRLEAGA